MQFDLGIVGLGLLLVLSLGFGLVAQLVVGTRHTRWMWLIGATAWFLGGLYFSEVLSPGRRPTTSSRSSTGWRSMRRSSAGSSWAYRSSSRPGS
jgi:hypothetical protein